MPDNFALVSDHFDNIIGGNGDFLALVVLKRRKDNPEMDENVECLTHVNFYSSSDLNAKKDYIVKLCVENNARAYVRVNIRNDKIIAGEFLKYITSQYISETYHKMRRGYDHVVGCTPTPGRQKYFLIDVDAVEGQNIDEECARVMKAIHDAHVKRKHSPEPEPIIVKTKSGAHILSRAFDVSEYNKLMGEERKWEVKRDADTLLYCADANTMGA